jgi:hypothetical protein
MRENMIVYGLLTAFSHFCKLKRNGLIERNNCRDNSQLCEEHQIILSDGRCFMGEDCQRLPRGRRYADDRAPALEEIRKLCEYS